MNSAEALLSYQFMKTPILTLVLSLLLPLVAQSADAVKVKLNKDEIKFQETLENCTFVGHWCLVKGGELTPVKDEKYTITSAKKMKDDQWVIFSRMQFGKTDVTVPIPVQLKWAGDTPVITLDKLFIPGVGTYSARVLVHDSTYAGTWSGGDYGGLLNGLIKKSKKSEDGK